MIPVSSYTPIYYAILFTAILLSTAPLAVRGEVHSFPSLNKRIGVFLLLTIVIGFIGLRDPWGSSEYFGDTISYTQIYYRLQTDMDFNISKDIGFYVFMRFFSYIFPISFFYFICSILYVIPTYQSLKKWFGDNAFFALILVVSSMSFWSYGINGLRNGLATSLFIFALSREKLFWKYGVMILAISFHSSMALPFIAYLIARNYRSTKVYLSIWLLIIPFSFLFGDNLETYISYLLRSIGLFESYRIENLYSDRFEVTTRAFRPDFLIYSAVPIIMGYWYIFKRNYREPYYIILYNVYVIVNSVWVLMIYAAFTNRIAYLSWFLYPIILCYPLLDRKNPIKTGGKNAMILYVMLLLSFVFTIVMEFK